MNFKKCLSIGCFLLTMGLTLAACTTLPLPLAATLPEQSREQRQLRLKHIEWWQLKGKMAVQTAEDSGSAMVTWVQYQQNYTLTLMGPLGTPEFTMTGEKGKVTLKTAKGKYYTAKNPEQLLIQQWGWHLPISYLHYWIRGLPVPHLPADSQFDAANRLQNLTQQGFTIQYLSYMQTEKGDLPNKLSISGPGLKTKIVIYEWKVK